MTQAEVEQAVRALEGLTVDRLRAVWRSRGGEPPRLQSGELLRRLLAERIQLEALGRDADLDRRIEAMVAARRRGREPAKPKPRLKVGTLLVREHGGVSHRVEVLHQGFRWSGATYASLSEIAREITGTRWNGPAFFGLRETKA